MALRWDVRVSDGGHQRDKAKGASMDYILKHLLCHVEFRIYHKENKK